LNQKLCDIRNQAASIAFGHVDDDFHADNDISTDLTQIEISELHKQYNSFLETAWNRATVSLRKSHWFWWAQCLDTESTM
jgi:hypothetical protein